MRCLVVGFGVSGKAAHALLTKKGADVVVVDKKGGENVLPDTADLSLTSFDQVILSPGIPSTHPIVQRAIQLGIEVIGEIELGLKIAKNKIFGITGSNGKTTTVTLTAHILNSAKKKVRAVGNVGDSLCAYLLERAAQAQSRSFRGGLAELSIKADGKATASLPKEESPSLKEGVIQSDPEELLILELSSFQLETMQTKALDVALVLNITPNHLDRHSSMEEYVLAKGRIQQCLKEGKNLFISKQVQTQFGSSFPNGSLFEKELALIDELSYTQLEMPSKQSVQAAYLLCKRCGVTDVEFLQGLSTYKKAPHRIEWVAKINAVTYYNDSKSSNIHSVIHAVGRMEGKVVLIVGGVHKGSSYQEWIEPFRTKVKQIIAYGKAGPIMEYELSPHFPFARADRFADAIRLAKQVAQKGEIVLLSPGCSSYDQFDNYEQRGEEFKRLVRES